MKIDANTLGVLFVALFTVYSPLANVGAYASITEHLSRSDQKKIAWRVLRNIVAVMLLLVFAGKALFELLGVSSDTIGVAGAIALMSAGIPMMVGTERSADIGELEDQATWQQLVVVPMTFPLSIGGTTAAYLVTASSLAETTVDLLLVSGVVVAFALVVFATHWFSPMIAARMGLQGRNVLNRVGGIVLVAIAVGLFASGLRALLPGLA